MPPENNRKRQKVFRRFGFALTNRVHQNGATVKNVKYQPVKKACAVTKFRQLRHFNRTSPVVDIFIHDSNVKNIKNNLSNEQHESITKNKTIKLEKGKSHILDLDGLNKLSKEHQNNPIIGYLNINSLRNKINDLRKICRKTEIHVLCIDETKLDESFPDAQFHIEGYQYLAYRKDLDKNGGGKIVYAKEGLITKRMLEYENVNI